LLARIVEWSVEVALHLLLAVLRPILGVLEELIGMALRIILQLLAYPESWIVIAVAVLWFMAGRSLMATVVAMTAVAGVAVRWWLRERGW
jgi:hypothetical protein